MRAAFASLLLIAIVAYVSGSPITVQRIQIKSPEGSILVPKYLLIEVLTDDLLHFEVSIQRDAPKQFLSKGIYTSQMVARKDYPGPSEFHDSSANGVRTISTKKVRLEIDERSLLITAFNIAHNPEYVLTTFTYDQLASDEWLALRFGKYWATDIYGLGEHYMEPYGSMNGNFAGLDFKLATNPYGNAMFSIVHDGAWKGMSELANFPIMYALGPKHENYAIFVDDVHAKEWFFDQDPFRVQMKSAELRWYLLAGQNLPELRSSYMDLVGRSPVPPKKAFGLWQSIFGYQNWGHVDHDVNSLVNPDNGHQRFPVDGVCFDIYWFGGGFYQNLPEDEARKSVMGNLQWDPRRFPEAPAHIRRLKEQGLGVLLIEESYVSVGSNGYEPMRSKGYLAKDCESCDATTLGTNGEDHWWGVGGMIDWSHEQGADYWFDCKHCPLIAGCQVDTAKCAGMLASSSSITARNGTQQPPAAAAALRGSAHTEAPQGELDVTGFWLDLGEPEMFHPWVYYKGYTTDEDREFHSHADIHNLFNLLWAQSLSRGFARNKLQKRPWMLARSGTSGINRFGTGMWSGDIYPDLRNMASSLSVQKHMSMVGIDYFGSDVGGFHRNLESDSDRATDYERYTQWLANSAWFDVPVRPHGWQPDGSIDIQTAPSKVGDIWSNVFNLRQRYALIPYFYSLAYRAWLYGEPVVPPMFFYYQNDLSIRDAGHQKLIGRDILVAASSTLYQRSRGVYLPEGRWYNYHTKKVIDSKGQWIPDVQQTLSVKFGEETKEVFILPVFIRAGALLPNMHVDTLTKNALGERWSARDEREKAEQEVASQLQDTLIVDAYVPASFTTNSFDVFEDDGESVAYQSQQYRRTTVTMSTDKDGVKFQIATTSGITADIKTRSCFLKVNFASSSTQPFHTVLVNGQSVVKVASVDDFYKAGASWVYASDSTVFIKTKQLALADSPTIELRFASAVTVADV
eukprot:GILK01004587.1.p1 GENE.GILK01004587.1~~GILK01004587.1.p1  ORF type:complete len:967 (+),score=134.16 GILK01004587.1:79-2979(+)